MPHEYKAIVTRIVDGDTIICDIDLGFSFWFRNQSVRLYGVDTPEIHSKDNEEVIFGHLSRQFVETFCGECDNKIILQTSIEQITASKEKFGRILAIVKNPITNKILNEELVKESLGVKYTGENKDFVKLQHLENRKKLKEFKGEY